MMCSLVTGVQTCALPIAALIAGIEAAGLTPFQFQQWEGKRLTRPFGWTYDFQTGRFAPGEPIPFWPDAIRSRAARFAGIDPDTPEPALLIHYGIGAGIGWPNDRPGLEPVAGDQPGARAQQRFAPRLENKYLLETADPHP